jgi:hypothetical protein
MRTQTLAAFSVLSLLVAAQAHAAPAAKRRRQHAPVTATADTAAPLPPPLPGPPPAPYYRPESLTLAAPPATGIFGAPERHDGLYLRLQLGTNIASLSKIEGSSVGLALDVAAGYSVIENLALFGELRLTNGLVGFGVGAVYYLMPINIYLGGSLMMAMSGVDGGYGSVNSNLGPAVSLQAGKEWWLSDQLGLGISAQLVFGSLSFDDPVLKVLGWDKMTVTTFSVAASATFN